ncbi:hypothetical protein D3C85_1103870 [compost metagenome]
MQGQPVGVEVVLGRWQIKPLVGACHAHLQSGLSAQLDQARGNGWFFQLLQFQVACCVHNCLSYAAWQSGLGIHNHLYGRASATFESAITLIEQALPFLFGKPRKYLAQPLRPVFQARGGVSEFFAHQRSGFAVRQGQEKGFQQVAVGEAGGVDFHHGYIGRRALPKGLRIFVDQSQAFVCRPVTVFIEQFQLCHGIRLEEVLRLVAADLIDKGLYVLIDPEAFECVGQ